MKNDIHTDYFGEFLRPWKLATLSIGLALLIAGSFVFDAPDWDIPISVIMAAFTYFTASKSMHIMIERAWSRWPWMLFWTWFSVDGCYTIYWYFKNPLALELMREANAPASLALYWMCGLLWYFNGSLREAFALCARYLRQHRKAPARPD